MKQLNDIIQSNNKKQGISWNQSMNLSKEIHGFIHIIEASLFSHMDHEYNNIDPLNSQDLQEQGKFFSTVGCVYLTQGDSCIIQQIKHAQINRTQGNEVSLSIHQHITNSHQISHQTRHHFIHGEIKSIDHQLRIKWRFQGSKRGTSYILFRQLFIP